MNVSIGYNYTCSEGGDPDDGEMLNLKFLSCNLSDVSGHTA